MGSGDRRRLRTWCFAFYRLGKLAQDWPLPQRLALGYFLNQQATDPLFSMLEWAEAGERIANPLSEKWAWLQSNFPLEPSAVFPQAKQISGAIASDALYLAQWQQPLTWIRYKSDHGQRTEAEVAQDGLYTFGFPQGLDLSKEIDQRRRYWIQDISSQHALDGIPFKSGDVVWDACCGSGGKSLLARHIAGDIRLLASDRRPQSLRQLEERFEAMEFAPPATAALDLLAELPNELHFIGSSGEGMLLQPDGADVVILDAPCSGSGTWHRDPDAKSREAVGPFSAWQRAMLAQIAPFVKPGGLLIYLTCSVYAAENEKHFENGKAWWQKPVSMEYINYLNRGGDVLFRAVLKKPLV